MGTPFQDVNLGAAPNDDTGDTIRGGGTKINANFQVIEDVLAIDDVNDRIGIGTAAPSHALHIVRSASEPASEEAIKVERTQDEATGGVNIRDINLVTNFIATDLTTPTNVNQGIRSICWFGGEGTSVAAKGTVHAGTFATRVTGSGHSENEHAALFANVAYEIGTGFTQTAGPAGRAWLTDFNVHGPIAVQPDLLTGVTQFINQYFNGAPLDQPAAAFAAVTFPGKGGGGTATHTAATTFPVDVGYAVYGKSGTVASPTGVGFKTAFQAGGTGSGWNASSLLERAFYGRDVTVEGLRLDTPGAGSPKGIVVSGATWGTLIDLSGVTSPPAVGILMASNDLRWNTDGGGNIGATGGVGRPASIFASTQVNIGGGVILTVASPGAGRVQLVEGNDPNAPAANQCVLYARDNGAGKTQLMARFNTGAIQQVAIEP